MLVFDASAAEVTVGQRGGAVCFNCVGTLSSSATIPCAETLSQVIIMGYPAHSRLARSLAIFDDRFKSLEIAAMAVGDSMEAAKSCRCR